MSALCRAMSALFGSGRERGSKNVAKGQERKSRTLCRQLLEVGSRITQKMAVGAAKPTTLEGRKHQV